jgi:hypothetical protein
MKIKSVTALASRTIAGVISGDGRTGNEQAGEGRSQALQLNIQTYRQLTP